MILIETAKSNERSLDAKVLLAKQLRDRGHKAVIDGALWPEEAPRGLQYDAAATISEIESEELSQIVLLGTEEADEATMIRLRSLSSGNDIPIAAFGRFANVGDAHAFRSRLAYATGREPTFFDLSEERFGSPLVSGGYPLAISCEGPVPILAPKKPRLFVYVPEAWADDTDILSQLEAMTYLPGISVSTVISGQGWTAIRNSNFTHLSLYRLSELPPQTFARLADMAAFFGEGIPGARMASFAAELLGAGKPVIDSTENAAFKPTGAPVLRGPTSLAALPNYVENFVQPNAIAIGTEARNSDWVASHSLRVLETALGLSKPPVSNAPSETEGRTVFFPTNGHGLGHARRCALVADELDTKAQPVFTAFPSCIPMLNAMGYATIPLVAKSDDHEESFANDLVTFRRLSGLVGPKDHLVFDGGYVFDSIFRVLVERRCRATWIRRGLFRPNTAKKLQLDRETEFDSVIIPGEAFEELNVDYSDHRRVHRVGPIVQLLNESDGQFSREELADRFSTPFEKLVVSMLGGGKSITRDAHMAGLCQQLETRNDLLHLAVVWPGTTITPSLFAWRNTKIVRTYRTGALTRIADFVISAAGYNSFHELLYAAVPTIFLPQVAPFLDDQERRAQAAKERGYAEAIAPDDFFTLQRTVEIWLEGERPAAVRTALSRAALPLVGNKDAAKLIEGAAK